MESPARDDPGRCRDPQAKEAIMLPGKRLGHGARNSGDLARAEKFYVGLFGLRALRREGHQLFLRCGDDYLSIRELPARKEGYLPAPADEVGLDPLGLAVSPEDFDQVLAQVKAAGVRVVRGPIAHNGGGGGLPLLAPAGVPPAWGGRG